MEASREPRVVERYLARENVKRLRERLASESDRQNRFRFMTLLIEEEDKLGAGCELLADLDMQIRRGSEMIARQAMLVAAMRRDGHDGIIRAESLLEGLSESQTLHERYRQRLLNSIEENKL